MEEANKIYKLDTKGKTRVWWIEYDDEKYRTHSGILDGKIVTSGWIYPTEKNIGKANHTTIKEQVSIEVNAEYDKKQYQGKYHTTIDEAAGGAKFVEAMLAQKYNPKKDSNFPYISQPKLDGIRCLVSKWHMQTRNGKKFFSCPHIQEELEGFFEIYPDVVLDGELYNHDLKNDFEKIVSLARKTKPKHEDIAETAKYVQYHVYDIITPKADFYSKRYEIITDELSNMNSVKIVRAEIVNNVDEVNNLMAKYLESGYEGQMLRVDAPYEHKRSKTLLKNKEFDDAEFRIVNIVEGVGNYSKMAKSLVIDLRNGITQSCGMRGKQDYLKFLLDNKEKYIGSDVTVRYQGKTNTGKLRFPVAVCVYEEGRDL